MHLHTAGNAERGLAAVEDGLDVARGPVSPGEQQQVEAGFGHGKCGTARVLSSSIGTGLADDTNGEAGGAGLRFAHGAGRCEELDRIMTGSEWGEGGNGAVGRTWRRSVGARLGQDVRTVSAFEPDAATHAGDGVND